MAITVPRLDRIEPSNTLPQNNRINIQANDQGSQILNRTQTIASLGDKVGDIYQKYEDNAIDSIAAENEKEFNNWSKLELDKLKQYQGDPTDAYADYDKRAKEKYDEIISKRSDVSDRVKRHVTSRFDKVYGNNYDASLYQRGMQKEVYDNNLFESNVKLKKDDLPIRSGYIKSGDDSSYFKFDEGLHDIKSTIVKQGLKKGTATQLPDDAKSWDFAYQDDEGKMVKVSLTPMAKQRIAKETSEGVKQSLDVMIASGQIENAKELKEKYKNYLDPVSAAKVEKKFTKADRRSEADNFLANIRGKSEEDKISAIENIKDGELKSEVLKIKDVDDARLERMKERKNKSNRDVLLKEINKLSDQGQPLLGMADLENNPVFKNMDFDSLDAKSQKAIREAVVQPKESSDKSLLKMNKLILGETDVDIESLSFEEFQSEYLTGLSKSDRNRYIREFQKIKDPSATQERSTMKRANQLLKDQLLLSGYIKKNEYNQIAGKNELKLLNAQDKLMNYLSTNRGQMNEEQLRRTVKELSAAEINGEVFNPQPVNNRPTTNNQEVTPTGAPTDTVLDGLSSLQVTKLMGEFKRTNNGNVVLRKDPRFLKFVKENKQRVLNANG